jgi:hypothetical protein
MAKRCLGAKCARGGRSPSAWDGVKYRIERLIEVIKSGRGWRVGTAEGGLGCETVQDGEQLGISGSGTAM